MTKRIDVENVVKAKEVIDELVKEGTPHDQIYVFSHEEDLEEKMAEYFGTEEVGVKEEGVVNKIKNIFSKRGDELRSQFQSLGLSEVSAAEAEEVLDDGRLVVVVTNE
ncbi:MAG TPA: general stress protein [Savagea sp.]